MSLYMCQFAYTPESWATQVKNPQNRIETVGPAVCEAAGGKFVGGWLCFGEYDALFIADMPSMESMAAIALAVTAGGAIKALERRAWKPSRRRTPSRRPIVLPDSRAPARSIHSAA
jgi:uncharacterized protein with GYD domain